MSYRCPLMSTYGGSENCSTDCALFLKDGKNATCAINIIAIHTLEVEKKIDLIIRNINH